MFAGFEGYPNDLAVTATDDTTLEFTLTAPCAYMEDLMAFPTFYPVKQSAVEAADGWRLRPVLGARMLALSATARSSAPNGTMTPP